MPFSLHFIRFRTVDYVESATAFFIQECKAPAYVQQTNSATQNIKEIMLNLVYG